MNQILERFLRYVQHDTASNEENKHCPSNPSERDFALTIAGELKELGLTDVTVDQNGYLFATIPANTSKKLPVIGFIAHLDTSPDCSGQVRPQIIRNYQGGNICLNEKENIVLSPKEFPELLDYLGDDLITTDGTSLLGADDKAGITAIVSAAEALMHTPFSHGTIKIALTPDEEIGRGADLFDVASFGADFAYTVDGGPVGELEYENFNAAKAVITVNGINVHPGYAKNKMKNAALIAAEFINEFPKAETPERTENYEGFYHLISLNGEVEKAVIHYLIRDFQTDGFAERKKFMQNLVNRFQQRYGQNTIHLELTDSYYNMKEKLQGLEHIIKTAAEAMKQCGVEPKIQPIRGGTDGARLSFMGLPTPNIFTGGHNFHGRYEFLPLQSLKKSTEVILKIIELYGAKAPQD